MSNRDKIRHKNLGFLKLFLIILTSGLCFLLACLIAFVIYATVKVSANLPDITNTKTFSFTHQSKIFAADGTTVLAELQLENRQPVESLDQISKDVITGTIATEDARFYYHDGVDIWGIFRAALVIATGGQTQGGSTITMQLIRNTVLTEDAQKRSLDRKIAEVILSKKMEELYSKDEILLMYLNTINYGDACYGIKAASQHYFSKNPDNLSLSESATLVGIPQSPTYLAPTNNIEACTTRRNLVLGRMYDDHVITKSQKSEAESQSIELDVSYADLNNNIKYPYFTDYVKEQLNSKYSKAEIFEGGFQITTTLNVAYQEATEAGCANTNKNLEAGAECVAVSVDPSTGYITSMVGGKNYKENQFNIATEKGRPTGSSFKAFTLVNSIEQGYDPYKTTLNCSSPMTINNVRIENFGNTNYGKKTVQGATAVSSNTGFVRLQKRLGTQNVINTARKLGVKEADLPNVDTLTLGVADITPLEMASSYATIANGGIYHSPISITKIESYDGEIIYQYDPTDKENAGEQVISPEIAGAATEVLKTVFTQGTASSAKLSSGQPVAGKTGTSEDYKDHTLIGYTPYCSLATWIGKRNYESTSSYLSCNTLFKSIMDGISATHQITDFPQIAKPTYTQPETYISDDDQNKKDQSQNTNTNNTAPNVVGKTYSEARSILSTYDLLIYQINSSTVPKGVVISQSMSDGKVVLYVSKGPAR